MSHCDRGWVGSEGGSKAGEDDLSWALPPRPLLADAGHPQTSEQISARYQPGLEFTLGSKNRTVFLGRSPPQPQGSLPFPWLMECSPF